MHGIDSTKLTKHVSECCDVEDEDVQDAITTVTSWFMANDGFRARMLTVPDTVNAAYEVIEQHIRNTRENQRNVHNND